MPLGRMTVFWKDDCEEVIEVVKEATQLYFFGGNKDRANIMCLYDRTRSNVAGQWTILLSNPDKSGVVGVC